MNNNNVNNSTNKNTLKNNNVNNKNEIWINQYKCM